MLWRRLQGCQKEPVDRQRSWLKYTMLCRKFHVLQLSHKNLVTISKFPDQLLEVIIHPQYLPTANTSGAAASSRGPSASCTTL